MSVVLRVSGLKKYFPATRSLLDKLLARRQLYVKAVDGVSFEVREREVLGLIGESGSGKTTTGRLCVRLLTPTSGRIEFMGKDITFKNNKELRPLRRYMQIIFQDPHASLNPRMSIGEALEEPLLANNIASKKEAMERALEILERVGLRPAEDFYKRYPHQLSGGQRQRVVVARAMMTKPKFVVADEAVSMIDVSMRISILELLEEFRRELGLSILFITHDIAVAKLICDKIAVMYLGKIVEVGPTKEVIRNPKHPYTRALLDAVPSITRRRREKKVILKGEIPSPINPPSGCRLHPRCPFAREECRRVEPELYKVGENHYVACHYPLS